MQPHISSAYYVYNSVNQNNNSANSSSNEETSRLSDSGTTTTLPPMFQQQRSFYSTSSVNPISLIDQSNTGASGNANTTSPPSLTANPNASSTPLNDSRLTDRYQNHQQRYFSYPSPRNHSHKQFSPQTFTAPTTVVLSHPNSINGNSTSVNNSNSNSNSISNPTPTSTSNLNSNYSFSNYDLTKRQSTAHQLSQYPSSPIQFTQTPPLPKGSTFNSSASGGNQCIQPSQLIQPIYLTPSSTPLSNMMPNNLSPNSLLNQRNSDTNATNKSSIAPCTPCTPSTVQSMGSYHDINMRYALQNPTQCYNNSLNYSTGIPGYTGNFNYTNYTNPGAIINGSSNYSMHPPHQYSHLNHIHHSNSTMNGKQIIPQVSRKRKRRKYCEINRIYKCEHPGCDKAYGTLNHLNFHIQLQKHGPKRLASEFKHLRNQNKD